MAQKKMDAKPNEIPAAIEVLGHLDIQGATNREDKHLLMEAAKTMDKDHLPCAASLLKISSQGIKRKSIRGRKKIARWSNAYLLRTLKI